MGLENDWDTSLKTCDMGLLALQCLHRTVDGQGPGLTQCQFLGQ